MKYGFRFVSLLSFLIFTLVIHAQFERELTFFSGILGSVPPVEVYEGEGLPTVSFSFTGEAGQAVIFHVAGSLITDESYAERVDRPDNRTASILQPVLEVYAPNGSLLARVEADEDSLHARTDALELPQSGTYRINVSSLNDTFGSFAIAVAPADLENNRKQIGLGETLVGLSGERWEDPWTFEGTAGQSIFIEILNPAPIVYSDFGGLDVQLELFAPDGSELASTVGGGNSYVGSWNSLGPIVLPETGKYTISALDIGFSDNNGIYNISVTERTANERDGEIIYFETLIGAFPADTTNEWTFDAEDGDIAILNLNLTDGDTNLSIEVTDPAGEVIHRERNANLEAQVFEIVTSGRHTIIISGQEGKPAEYHITLTRAETTEERSIAFGQTVTDVFLKDDTHRWTFEAQAGDVVEIDSSQDFRLFTPSNEDYSYISGINSPDINRRNLALSEAGTWTIEVTAYVYYAYQPYTISLREIVLEMPDQRIISFGQSAMGSLQRGEAIDFVFDVSAENGTYIYLTAIEQNSNAEIDIQLIDSANLGLSGLSFSPSYSAGVQYGNYSNSLYIPQAGQYRLRLTSEYEYGLVPYFFGLYTETNTPLEFSNTIVSDGSMSIGESIFIQGKREQFDENPEANIITFEGTAGQAVQILTTNVEYDLPEMVIKVYDPDGNFITENYTENGYRNQFVVNLSQDGTYTLEITAINYPVFQLNLALAEDDLRLGLLHPLESYTRQDPNDLPRTRSNEWTFYGRVGDVIGLRLYQDSDIRTQTDPLIELYGPDGRFVAENDDFDDLNSFLGPLELTQEGLYTVVVQDYNGSFSDYRLIYFDRDINPLRDEADAIEACTVLTRQAYEAIATACVGTTGANEACLASTPVLLDGAANASFSSAGDVISLDGLGTMQSSALDESNSGFGMVYMNIPVRTVNESTTTIRAILIGDAAFQNPSVDPSLAPVELATEEAVEVEIVTLEVLIAGNQNINVRSGPGTGFAVTRTLTAGTVYTAIGRNADGSWLEIQFEDDSIGWASASLLTTEGDISSLAVTNTSSSAAPAQNNSNDVALYFSSASGDSQCKRGSESGLLLYAPELPDYDRARIRINGLDIEFTGIIFVQAEAGGVMRIYNVESNIVQFSLNNDLNYVSLTYQVSVPINNDLNVSGTASEQVQYDYRVVRALPIRYIRQ